MDASDQMSEQWRTAGFRDAGLMPVDLDVRREPDGAMVMRSRVALAEHDWNLPRAFAGVAARRGRRRPWRGAIRPRAGSGPRWTTPV